MPSMQEKHLQMIGFHAIQHMIPNEIGLLLGL